MTILDLSRVLSCDPAGLAVLIGTQRRASLLGVTVCLTAPSHPVAKLLRSTGLDRHFTMYPNYSSALAPERFEPARTAPAPARPGDRRSRIPHGRPRQDASQGFPSITADGELPPAGEEVFKHYGLPYQAGTRGERQLARR